MPDTRANSALADEPTSDGATQLELNLQRQFEEDVARIFDESIYSDIEVECGKLKILTHSCILKARTNSFYNKLDTILHANIDRKAFDEIYSFVSDIYTECDINYQENEIIAYLDKEFNKIKSPTKEKEEKALFFTPKCMSPYEENIFSSPSKERVKEYYALVDCHLLENELLEQDVLSNALQSIKNKKESVDSNTLKLKPRNKPTSLSLTSSHTSKTVKHSNRCDIFMQNKDSDFQKQKHRESEVSTSQNSKSDKILKNTFICKFEEPLIEKVADSAYSPDSLVADDPSSSSDYLSAANTCSPAVSCSSCLPVIDIADTLTKMENITSSDSGLENTALLESLNSHKDITLTDVSLTESTLHDLNTDDAHNSFDAVSSPLTETNQLQRSKVSTTTSAVPLSRTASDKDVNIQKFNKSMLKDMVSCNSSKEEKQRHNEEIVILESSSLSSETGSWEPVFPPRLDECKISEKLNSGTKETCDFNDELCPSLVQKSPFKSTSCFIDAASLVDTDDTIRMRVEIVSQNMSADELPLPSQPLPCSTIKPDISPNDGSESNENEDSLEQCDKDTDSIQKDMSPTIFEMTPITEDSLCTNAFETLEAQNEKYSTKPEEMQNRTHYVGKEILPTSRTKFASSTPHNSMMILKGTTLKQFESEDSDSDTTIIGRERHASINHLKKYNEFSPIISGGASIEDHLPQVSSSPLTRRKVENMPIVTGAYIEPIVDHGKQKPQKSSSAWVVDISNNAMSKKENTDISCKCSDQKFVEKVSEESNSDLKSFSGNCNKSSGDSESYEKSSHKFYIDLSNLPDPSSSKKQNETIIVSEKKNIFSMYIDLGERTTVKKEMPARLSSLNANKNSISDNKSASKLNKSSKVDTFSLPSDSLNTYTFEQYETLCNDPNISITEIIKLQQKHISKQEIKKNRNNSNAEKNLNSSAVIEKEPTNKRSNDLFVKLSDLDKPVQKADMSDSIPGERSLDVRMTRSIPDNRWEDQNQTGTSRSIEVISSFHSENALSLNRLFPHLKNEFSRSMPGSLSSRTRSPLRLGMYSCSGEVDNQAADISEFSSVQSSICRSVVENSTTEETSQTSSLIGNCQSRLGQDLLRMFLEEIAPDVVVEVSGRRIKAHKCILSSRCQYFAAILSGGWVESAGNVISLPPFSFNVVHFALCHIYSGVSSIPDSISIVELATLADMLGLEGLKEAIMFTLKSKYCHHFHKPCAVCTAGVLECFPLSSVYSLDDLYRKCLRWITKHFCKVWPTKAFATLPKELLDKCYQQHVANLSTENFVETVYGCGNIVSSLQNTRWAESVARMCRKLVNAAAHFSARRLVTVLHVLSCELSDATPPAIQALNDCLTAAIEWAPPEEACRAYAYLSTIVKEIKSRHFLKLDISGSDEKSKALNQNSVLVVHAASWRLQCEGALVRAAPRVVTTQAFRELPPDLRKRLRELGCIIFGMQSTSVNTATRDKKSRSTCHNKTNKVNTSTTRSLDIDHVRASFVPYTSKPTTPAVQGTVLKNDLPDIKRSISTVPPKIRTTKAQEERAKYNLSKTTKSQEQFCNKLGLNRNTVKSKYLEPKIAVESDKKIITKKLVNRMVSSSESSRNSSPIQARNLRGNPMKSHPLCETKGTISQDSLATSSRPRTAEPSTDSLSESQTSNKYATYTKTKHATKGSVECVNAPKCRDAGLMVNNKGKTKIPVYSNIKSNRNNNSNDTPKILPPCKVNITTHFVPLRNKTNERRLPGSLMSATKSSSAKMVPKIIKDSSIKTTSKQTKRSLKHTSRQEEHEQYNIPTMERSGTFLKDEPTFGDRTTNIDIDQ